MRRVPTRSLRPGMRVGHPVFNSKGETLINRDVILNEKYIKSLLKLEIPALYIIDDSLPDYYVEDVIDEKSRLNAIKLARDILQGRGYNHSPLEWSLLEQAKNSVNNIIERLLQNPNIMVNLIDIRCVDDYLFGHSVNVCVLSIITGITLGYSKAKLTSLGMGALMHDMGKALIPPKILNKPTSLTDEEYNVIKRHPELGHTILNNSEMKKTSAMIALQHHERYNGRGYPRGIANGDIHEYSQIVGMADIYDAMTHDRVYRKASPPHEAYELLAGSGNFYFDFYLVQSFLSHIAAYPVGSIVKLNTDEIALVVEIPKGFCLYPKVKVIFSGEGKRLPQPVDLELLKNRDYSIYKVLDTEEIEQLKKSRSA